MMRYSILRLVIIVLFISLFSPSAVAADMKDTARDEGQLFAKPLEVLMVDGPFYLDDEEFYVVEYLETDSTVAASLVFEASSESFTINEENIRKVLATKDLKRLTIVDPLFFALGDPNDIIFASKYETENVRNFASFSDITVEEAKILEIFLKDYEDVMADVANVSRQTQNILYPENALDVRSILSPPSIEVNLKEGFEGGYFSYEGLEKLVEAYRILHRDYRKLSSDLSAFAGGLPEYQPGAVIREKWEVQITKEGILEEVNLIEVNGEQMKRDIDLREKILSHTYETQILESKKRMGIETPPPRNSISSLISKTANRIKNFLLGLFGIGLLLTVRRGKKFYLILLTIALLLPFMPPPSMSLSEEVIPSYSEIISKKVAVDEKIPYQNYADGLSDQEVEIILSGFRLVLKGESVEAKGPYNHYGTPYYFFNIKNEGESSGYGFLVDAEKLRLVGDQRMAFQLIRTLQFSTLVEREPIYKDVDADLIGEKAKATIRSPLDLFLTNLSRNVKEGYELESSLVSDPDFATLINLTDHYVEAYILLQNINQLLPQREADALTGGFSKKVHLLDTHSRAVRGLSTGDYLLGRIAQYRGRTLNRIPLIMQLSLMGLRPSKAQVAHDLTSDLIHDNIYIWMRGKVENPALFARLSFREGTFTTPKSAFNTTG